MIFILIVVFVIITFTWERECLPLRSFHWVISDPRRRER